MLIKYVRQDGTGDYTNITTAFNDMLVSGVAASGDITDYVMDVGSGYYAGVISGFIPYSGTFNIIGSGSYLQLVSGLFLTGTYAYSTVPNLHIENFTIDCSGLTTNWYTIPSGFGLKLKTVQLLNDTKGILNLGGVSQIDNISSCGISGSSTYFIYDVSGNYNSISNSYISDYGTGVYCKNISINNSTIHDNYLGVGYTTNHSTNIIDTLMYNNVSDINVNSGYLYLTTSTFNSPIYITNTYIIADRIISSSAINISGSALSGSIVENSCIYPGTPLHSNISGSYNINSNPKFNDVSIKDYRLQFKQTAGSPCVEVKPNLNLDSSISFGIDTSRFSISDAKGPINPNEFLGYVYTQDDTIVFSDYNKEIFFAEQMNYYKNLKYEISLDVMFDELNVLTKSAFDSNNNLPDSYPWDWDEAQINTAQITKYNTYIVPRSVIDIESIISSKIGVLPSSISYNKINKENIKVFTKFDYRGITTDYNQSNAGQSIVWLIDGANQTLVQQNLYTGEEIGRYPLLCNKGTKSTIRPSGLIYTGVRGDYYTFIKQTDPNIELLGLTELGEFYWIPNSINTTMDVRGIKCYKDNLFITCSQYPISVTDRTIVPSGNPIGRLLQYDSNNIYFNYIKSPGETNGPLMHNLASGNYYPTDVTIYEDGTLFIADYLSTSGIYKYTPAYDYALVSSSYDNETRVLLREQYDNIEI